MHGAGRVGQTDGETGMCDVISSGRRGRKTLSNKLLSVLLSTENHVHFGGGRLARQCRLLWCLSVRPRLLEVLGRSLLLLPSPFLSQHSNPDEAPVCLPAEAGPSPSPSGYINC